MVIKKQVSQLSRATVLDANGCKNFKFSCPLLNLIWTEEFLTLLTLIHWYRCDILVWQQRLEKFRCLNIELIIFKMYLPLGFFPLHVTWTHLLNLCNMAMARYKASFDTSHILNKQWFSIRCTSFSDGGTKNSKLSVVILHVLLWTAVTWKNLFIYSFRSTDVS